MQSCYSFREMRGDFLQLFGVPNLVGSDHLEPLAEVQGAKKGMGHVIFS